MATRLDRLLVLLESGSTPVARKAAAEQIGEIQKLHPHELNNLLRKVSKYLKHKSWETRIAAAQAVEAIAKNVRKWDPTSPTPSPQATPTGEQEEESAKMEAESGAEPVSSEIELLSFEKFDITQVLQFGTPLLSSTGEEFAQLDTDSVYQKMSFQEKASFHRQQLKERLGLMAQGKVFSTGLEQLFDDDDLVCTHRKPLAQKPVKQENDVMELNVLSGMSARERNRAKRKAKMAARKVNRNKGDDKDSDTPDAPPTKIKPPPTSSVIVEQTGGDTDKLLIDQVRDPDMIFEDSNEWPFTWFCEEMLCQLFNPQWELRHGAASALREIIKLHGDTAGITATTPVEERSVKTQCWLSDVAIRLLCVFALDRFADFVSDQVVAPVRATCAQVLGIVCHQLEASRVGGVIDTLLTLVRQDMWEVRHAALMGIQHLLASRMDLSHSLLPVVADSILNGLRDQEDDVRTVAATSLLPVADKLYTILRDKIPLLLDILWDSLIQLDDLSASTSAVMDLLSYLFVSLQQHSDVSETLLPSTILPQYIPRVYPFLSHTISTVRSSSLSAIMNLVTTRAQRGAGESCAWIQELLEGLVCQVFQRLAVEGDEAIRTMCLEVWNLVLEVADIPSLSSLLSAHLIQWLSVLVTSSHLSIDPTVLVGALQAKELRDGSNSVFLGGCFGVESVAVKDQSAFAARVVANRAIGLLAQRVFPSLDSAPQYFLDSLRQMSLSNNATYKVISSLVIIYWRRCPTDLVDTLLGSLSEQILYEELAPFLLSLQKECHVLVSAFDKKEVDVTGGVNPSGYTADFAVQLASTTYETTIKSLTLTEQEKQDFDSYHRNLLTTLGQLQDKHQALQGRVQCCCAGGLVAVSALPKKLTPVIRPLMECLKTQSDSLMQSLTAEWLSQLLDLTRDRSPSPNGKILKNLCGYVYCDVNHTPSVTLSDVKSLAVEENLPLTPSTGIISLVKHMRKVGSFARRKGRGRPSMAVKEAMAEAVNLSSGDNAAQAIQRMGGEVALASIAKHFGDKLFVSLPQLWSEMTTPLPQDEQVLNDDNAQSTVNALQVLEVLTVTVHSDLKQQTLSLLPRLLKCLVCPYTAVRHMAARCISSFAKLDLHHTMKFLLDDMLPYLGATVHEHRQGAIEAIGCLLEGVGMTALCYIVFLIMPVLGKMSDQQRDIRLMASQCFACLVTLMPLESGADSPPEMSPDLSSRRVSERRFLEQLLDTKKLETYCVRVPINADLRKYQQDGINWLGFLNRYSLHGILCDDMGLGKTLQSICIVASDHNERQMKHKATGQADCAPLSSIVVCPPTLTGHWAFEVKKFCSPDHLSALQYHGPPATRSKLQKLVPKYNLIIVSYDVIRNDIDFFRTIHWNYCILDEGHIIKNARTKITKAVKAIRANHRLILSGTPIQNNVLELWSLFDFLMPGFLGTERQFNERFGRPILLSRDAKSSSKEQESGALAMENLHRQVLPFLLRRMKEDVLQDLPPKIIQDYHCDLSPLQVQLYEDFARSRAQKQVEEEIGAESTEHEDMETTPTGGRKDKKQPGETHIFQALQYLRKVCNHPALVVTPSHPMYTKVMEFLKKDKSTLHSIQHSAKLLALKQLLNECGIGVDESCDGDHASSVGGAVVSQHRVLLFCQFKSILDIIEKDLFKVHMPSVTYLRLDGSVPANSRHDLVQRFNLDPSIDLLLLTTHVGGLGLNLTGADTVIFFEHDWNPMKDLQAMDRAHRIGQKRVVNVYRLITRGTLEEKIMSLQKFKLNIANTVITQENSSLLSMNTSDILDLFQLGDKTPMGNMQLGMDKPHRPSYSAPEMGGAPVTGTTGLRGILEGIPELWEEGEYGGEYNMKRFMQSLSATTPNTTK